MYFQMKLSFLKLGYDIYYLINTSLYQKFGKNISATFFLLHAIISIKVGLVKPK